MTQVGNADLSGDGLGLTVWPGSRALLHWLHTSPDAPDLRGTELLELGCGTGALALALALHAGSNPSAPIEFMSGGPRDSSQPLGDFIHG